MSERKRPTLMSACVAYGAWLGAMLERHARGRRMLPLHRDDAVVDNDAASFGVVQPAFIDLQIANEEYWHRWRPRREPAIDALIRRVVDAGRGWRHEDALHIQLIAWAPTTPPPDVVHMLIDRGHPDTIHVLGHGTHDDAVLWRLVDVVPEAAQTLALRRYGDPECPDDKLDEALYHFRTDPGFAAWLAEWLGCMAPSSANKARLAARSYHDACLARGEQPQRRRKHHPLFAAALDEIARL